MSKTIVECVDNARQCAWYASKTKNEAEQKFLILLAERWIELAAEKNVNCEILQGRLRLRADLRRRERRLSSCGPAMDIAASTGSLVHRTPRQRQPPAGGRRNTNSHWPTTNSHNVPAERGKAGSRVT